MECLQCHAANPDGPGVAYCRACGAALEPQAGSYAEPTPGFGDSYSAPPSPVYTPAAVTTMAGVDAAAQAMVLPYGGFWIRLVAYVIDYFLVGIMVFAISIVFGVVAAFGNGDPDILLVSTYGLALLISLTYYVGLPPFLGGTPGKLMLGYMVVGPDGRKISIGRSCARHFSYIISSLPFCLGFIWIGPDAYKQGWHDKIASTFVVRKEFVQP